MSHLPPLQGHAAAPFRLQCRVAADHCPLLGRVVACALLLLVHTGLASAPARAQLMASPSAARTSAPEAWACTAVPDRFWLPLSVLQERLTAQGHTVIAARATRDDCYEIRLRGPDLVERTVIFDPVSAKPLK